MNKLFLALFFILGIFPMVHPSSITKQQKIAELFELIYSKKDVAKTWDPLFKSIVLKFLNRLDKKSQKIMLDKYFDNIKAAFIAAYDEFFNDTNIDELLKFYSSETGKKYTSLNIELNNELQKAHYSTMKIIQELLPKPESAAPQSQASSSSVIHFDDIAKGKNEKDVRDLFNKELTQDGLTVVKFSATWCGPCKSYAPDFEKVANELREIAIGDKKVTVKYIATDIEVTPVTAQDYSVVSVPTTIFFKNGQKIDSQAGYITSEALKARIQELAKN